MFGKGIYFADVISKAANYCLSTPNNNVGLMLLCEVALGQTQDLYFANGNIAGLPNENQQSVRACGATFPTQYSRVDNVYIASGNLCRAQFPTALHYNEYVISAIVPFFHLHSPFHVFPLFFRLSTIRPRFESSIWWKWNSTSDKPNVDWVSQESQHKANLKFHFSYQFYFFLNILLSVLKIIIFSMRNI